VGGDGGKTKINGENGRRRGDGYGGEESFFGGIELSVLFLGGR